MDEGTTENENVINNLSRCTDTDLITWVYQELFFLRWQVGSSLNVYFQLYDLLFSLNILRCLCLYVYFSSVQDCV